MKSLEIDTMTAGIVISVIILFLFFMLGFVIGALLL
jgi:hypothetical protein